MFKLTLREQAVVMGIVAVFVTGALVKTWRLNQPEADPGRQVGTLTKNG